MFDLLDLGDFGFELALDLCLLLEEGLGHAGGGRHSLLINDYRTLFKLIINLFNLSTQLNMAEDRIRIESYDMNEGKF